MINKSIVFSLENRILIYNFNFYIDYIEDQIYRYIDDWSLLTENCKIPDKTSYFEDILNSMVKEQLNYFKSLQKKMNLNGIVVFNSNLQTDFSIKFENYKSFLDKLKKIIKKYYKKTYFVDYKFNMIIGTYQNIDCIELNGEECEFLLKNNLT